MDWYWEMKQDFLVVYEYGAGGLWAVVQAESALQIVEKYPRLEVLDSRPIWMTDDDYNKIRERHYLNIDEEPKGWIARMAAPNESENGISRD